MTLIIGCITKDFGIMAGDVQLTRKGLLRRGKWQRGVEIKVGNYSPGFLMGILGNWSSWYNDENGVVYRNHYEVVKEQIPKGTDLTQQDYVRKYLNRYKEDINASAVIIEFNGKEFLLGNISTEEESPEIKNLQLGQQAFSFNEPYNNINDTWVDNKIRIFKEIHDLNDGLVDSLFLMNNIILGIIAEGGQLDIRRDRETFFSVDNTIGGYVTLQVITRNSAYVNKFSMVYSGDYSCLLDKTTFPFSKYLDQDKTVRYIDNLAMLVKNVCLPHNENLRGDIVQLVNKQVNYLGKSDLVDKELLNKIITYFNEKYQIEIQEVVSQIVKEENDEIDIAELVFDYESPKVDEHFLYRFF